MRNLLVAHRGALIGIVVGAAVLVAGGSFLWAVASNRDDIDQTQVILNELSRQNRELARQNAENKRRDRKIARDRRQGRDQICRSAEREHKRMVRGLRTTYGYLLSLNDQQLHEPLNQILLGQLRRTESVARHDPAPAFCDNPGLGLPEPDPRIPHRPARINRLLDTSR